MQDLYRQLAALAKQYGAQKMVLLGSRARGDSGPRSDIDLAVYGMPEQNQAAFWMDCEELPTLLKLDVVHIQPGMNPQFLKKIEKDGVTLYAAKD
ncbi:MAG: nucleotidyltransferase domain-containing protein [bacterium]|nr:nucleotidyltransferase domain-containing protein [bacterium]